LQKKIQGINFSENHRKYFGLTILGNLKIFMAKLVGRYNDDASKKEKRDPQKDKGDSSIY